MGLFDHGSLLGEIGLNQPDPTPEWSRAKHRPDTQKYIPDVDEAWRGTLAIVRDGLGPDW